MEARLSIDRLLIGILMIIVIAPYAPAAYAKVVQNSASVQFDFASSTMNMPLPPSLSNPPNPPPPPVPSPPICDNLVCTFNTPSAPRVVRILVIAAAFSDVNATKSISEVRQEYFGTVGYTVANYYREVSYGAISIEGDVVGWVNLTYPMAHYGRDCTAIDDADCSGEPSSWKIAQDSIGDASKVVDLTNYDYLVVIHSGVGQETSRNKNTVWSVAYLGGIWIRATVGNSGKGKSFNKFDIAPELEDGGAVPIGVWCHELGHLLGLPDLYDTSNGHTIMGPWELMDKGLWNGNPPGTTPAHMTAWDKIKLGWINGSSLAIAKPKSLMNFTVNPTEANTGGVHAIEVPVSTDSPPSDYYLVEVRQHIGFDSGLPSVGVLITSVNPDVQHNLNNVVDLSVIDAHPTTTGLVNATWGVGQVFVDQQHNLAIAVTGQVGYAYQVTVNSIGSMPDLAVGKISTQPSTISPNATVTIAIGIVNQGTASASNVPVQVNLDGKPLTTSQVTLNPGAETNITLTWKAIAGTHVLQVVIDPQNTITELSKANNVATYTMYVGTQPPPQPKPQQQPQPPPLPPQPPQGNVSLIVTLPPAVASGNTTAWVKINGIQYHPDNSSQIKTVILSGNVTLEAQSAITSSPGVRQDFAGWSDGSTQNPRQLTVNSTATLQALYKTQYLLAVNSNGGVTSGAGWYNPNSTVTATANSPSNVTNLSTRLLFTQWSGDVNSNSTSLSITLTRPMTLIANWKMQYYINVVSTVSSISGGGWYDLGSKATISAQSPIVFQNNTRRVFAGWSGTVDSQEPTTTLTVNAPSFVQAQWKTQYLVQVLSSYGSPQGTGWYDAGTNSQVSIQPQVDSGNRTRRVFSSWTGDYSGSEANVNLKVDAPKTLVAHWRTQYEVDFRVQGIPNSTSTQLIINDGVHVLSVPTAYTGWFNEGDEISPITNQTVRDQFVAYPFQGWRNSTGGAVTPPFTVSGPADYTAVYQSTFSLPPLPGFPLESILGGIILGLLGLAFIRRRRKA